MRRCFLVALCLTAVLIALTPAARSQEAEFCWRDSYGRGAGEIPESCPDGREMIGLLCYEKCPAGSKRFGFDCHSVCPSGMRDDGLYCRAAEYGRGAGYTIMLGEFDLDEAKKRCEIAERQECEQWGLFMYPKCREGYSPFGCCICRPEQPDCAALGLGPQFDLSCQKIIRIGSPVTGECAAGEEEQAGLCYDGCNEGYEGVGPVCWGEPPSGWVECGMGAATSDMACGSKVFDQVSSVGQLAAFVASAGSSGAATGTVKAATGASKLSKVTQAYTKMKTGFETLRRTNKQVDKLATSAESARAVRRAARGMEVGETETEADMIREAAEIVAILDPTGISDTVAAYTYPKCSEYFPPAGEPGEDIPVTAVPYEGLLHECRRLFQQGQWRDPFALAAGAAPHEFWRHCITPAVLDRDMLAGDCACVGRTLHHEASKVYRCEEHSPECGGQRLLTPPAAIEALYTVVPPTFGSLLRECEANVRESRWHWSCDVPAVRERGLLSGECACVGRTLQHNRTGLYRCEGHSPACGGVSFEKTLGYAPNMSWYQAVP